MSDLVLLLPGVMDVTMAMTLDAILAFAIRLLLGMAGGRLWVCQKVLKFLKHISMHGNGSMNFLSARFARSRNPSFYRTLPASHMQTAEGIKAD